MRGLMGDKMQWTEVGKKRTATRRLLTLPRNFLTPHGKVLALLGNVLTPSRKSLTPLGNFLTALGN